MGSPVEVGNILAGKYRVERTIGAGGMGVVVEATDTRLERRVAIKFLLPDYAEHGEAASRFMREARAAVKIKSDHTARVIDVGTMENGSPYMVMEYLEGADVAQILERDGVLSVEDAALYIIQACEAVAEAHSHGIVHRDLKPANLFLAQQPDGSLRIKVLDFGISKVADTQLEHSLTRTSSMMGSPLYMSPEQMRSTRSVDLRTDIWALGVIFYEMVTGSLPFIANSVPELSAKVLLEAHEPLSSRRPDLPLALERVVTRALCKNASERYPSIAEFALELLPFAPHRARHNVERISKVLCAAGLSTSRFKASVPPGPMSFTANSEAGLNGATLPGHDGGSTRDSRVSVVMGGVSDATQANFGQTSGPKRRGRAGLFAAAVLGIVGLAAAAAFLIPKQDAGTRGGSTVDFAKQPAVDAQPVPKRIESPPVAAEAPAAPRDGALSLSASAAGPSEGPAEAGGDAAPTKVASVAAIEPRPPRPRHSARPPRQSTKAKAPAEQAEVETGQAAGELGQFGGRK
ncbi:MAG TPA: protein kinase [Polyangiaceae bacterium]|nr:protein kinase [Polyangiaceae bacterium]